MRAHYAGLAANLGMPGLTGGDLVRGTYLVRTVGLQRVAVASVVDRFVDTFTIAAFIVVALPVAGIPPGYETAVRVIRIGVGLAIAAAAIALVVLRRRRSASTSAQPARRRRAPPCGPSAAP